MLPRIVGNPIMVAVMNGVPDIMTRFLRRIDPYDNSFVTPSRRRFLKHFAAGNADAAVAETETLLKRLEKNCLSRVTVLEPVEKQLKQTPNHAHRTKISRIHS